MHPTQSFAPQYGTTAAVCDGDGDDDAEAVIELESAPVPELDGVCVFTAACMTAAHESSAQSTQ